MRQGLARTRAGVLGHVSKVLKGRRAVDEAALEEVEELLLAADVGPALTERIVGALQDGAGENAVDLLEIARREVRRIFEEARPSDGPSRQTGVSPYVILVVGVNGSGKTTTIGKLAHRYRRMGKKVLLAAADTFRAAADAQLAVWAERTGAQLVRSKPGADPAAVAYDAVRAAQARGMDVAIVDTAGRLHTKRNLMAELAKVHRVIGKAMPGAPHEVLLVLDATVGQNALHQAKEFAEAAGVTGLVIAKLDGTAKGGAVLPIVHELHLLPRYIGIGEGPEDLEDFDVDDFVRALLE